MTKIYYYISPSGENPVSNFLNTIPKDSQAKLIRIFHYIEAYGINVPLKHIRKLSGFPLWEIRILGKTNFRVIYAVVYKGDVLLLHGFLKKSRRISPKELNTANSRFMEWTKSKIGT